MFQRLKNWWNRGTIVIDGKRHAFFGTASSIDGKRATIKPEERGGR